jgi:hypothetical protein
MDISESEGHAKSEGHAMQPSDDNVTRRGRTCNVYRRILVKTPIPNNARKRELTVRYQFRFVCTVRPLTNERPCTACLSATRLPEGQEVSVLAAAPRLEGLRPRSVLDIGTVNLGPVLRPLTADDDLLGEMLEAVFTCITPSASGANP